MPLRPGQCVRGARRKRPTLLVPPAGLVVAADGVRFENVDFVWRHAAAGGALVQLRAAGGEFHGCTFDATAAASLPSAIAWTQPAAATAMSLPSGRLQLRDCVFFGVGAAIDCRTVGAVRVEMSNTLLLGGGAALRLDHRPKLDEPLLLDLSRVTLRETGSLLECLSSGRREAASDGPPAAAGGIAIQAAGCVFAPAANGALLLFHGPDSPAGALAQVRWTGQGSLVAPDAAIAAWRRDDGREETFNDAGSISGLVRGAVEFAGNAGRNVSASRAARWQAPLLSPDAPGVDPGSLPSLKP